MYHKYEELIGQTVTNVELLDEGERIVFTLANGTTESYRAKGDCCSRTWIEPLDAPELLLGKVLAVEDIDMPNNDSDREEFDVITYYGLKITTDKGICVIDYRNESKGYYGGYLEREYY